MSSARRLRAAIRQANAVAKGGGAAVEDLSWMEPMFRLQAEVAKLREQRPYFNAGTRVKHGRFQLVDVVQLDGRRNCSVTPLSDWMNVSELLVHIRTLQERTKP